MKTVSGKLISSKPLSLSKAAKNLSGFAAIDNGASDAVSVYLKRAADAFNSLVGFHKELKNPHSLHKHQASHVKIEEVPDAGKIEILWSRGKSKKNPDFQVKIEEPVETEQKPDLVIGGKDEKDLKKKRKDEKNQKEAIKIEQIPDEVGEKMEKKKHSQDKVKIEESMDIEQTTPDRVGEKRKRKKHKKEKVKNEEIIQIDQSPHREAEDKGTQLLDEGGKGKKNNQESEGIPQDADEIERDSVNKREKKKRKKRDGEDSGERVELEERKSTDVDGGETIDLADQSSKKKRKRRKTEGGD